MKGCNVVLPISGKPCVSGLCHADFIHHVAFRDDGRIEIYNAVTGSSACLPVRALEMSLWLVGRWTGSCAASVHWEFQGVFDSRARAEAACRDESYCVMPVALNKEIPHETSDFPHAYYPRAGQTADVPPID